MSSTEVVSSATSQYHIGYCFLTHRCYSCRADPACQSQPLPELKRASSTCSRMSAGGQSSPRSRATWSPIWGSIRCRCWKSSPSSKTGSTSRSLSTTYRRHAASRRSSSRSPSSSKTEPSGRQPDAPTGTLPQALAAAACARAGYCFVTRPQSPGVSGAPAVPAGPHAGGVDDPRSYADLERAAFQVARSLREAGLRRGDLVAIVLPDAEAFLTTLFGASMAGVIPASFYPPSSTSDLPRYFDLTIGALRSAAARAVVTSAALAPEFDARRAACPDLALVLARESLDAPAAEPDTLPSLDDIAFVQFTSGSTSMPKGVVLTHRNLCANIDAINGPSGLAIGRDDVAVSWLPLNHDMGL